MERFPMSGVRSVLSLCSADDSICNFGQGGNTGRNMVEIDQGVEMTESLYILIPLPVDPLPIFIIEFDVNGYSVPGLCLKATGRPV